MIYEKKRYYEKEEHEMVRKGEQSEFHSYHFRQLSLAQLLHLIAKTRLEGVPKGIIVIGTCGIGKTIGVVTYLQVEKH